MTTAREQSLLRPYALQTEQREKPLGLDARRPRLSWRLACDRRGAAQTAYRITAAELPEDLDVPLRLLWDSGRQESDEGLLVPWDGPAVRSATRYHWRVEVWDESGAPAGSAVTWFETGLLHGDEWTAAWIGRDPIGRPPADPPQDHDRTPATHSLPAPLYLRRAFDVARRPVRARLYATARGIYEPRLNGQRIGDLELAPGWTEYHHRIQYQTYDVTDLVRAGGNVLGAVVADGWWSGYVGFDPRRPALHYGDAPAYLAQLVLDFADGSRRVVATDAGWTEGPGEIQMADLLMGEYVDARRRLPGWDTPGSDLPGSDLPGSDLPGSDLPGSDLPGSDLPGSDLPGSDLPGSDLPGSDLPGSPEARFRPVAVLDDVPGPLVAEPDHPVRVTQSRTATGLHRKAAGRSIADFGQNLVGRVRLTVRGAEPGRRIVLRHAETLAGGELYLDNLRRAEAVDAFVCAGGDVEVFEPRFAVHGFRYVEIDNHPPDLSADDVTALVIHSDTPWTGRFESSDPTVNRLQSNIIWGQRGNFVSVPTDCPQRDERLGWLADAQIFAPTASRNADVSAFFARWMRDVLDGQDADGAFRDVAPVVSLNREGAPAWGDGAVIIPWHLWRTYGDVEILRRAIDPMIAWVAHIRRHNPDLVWRHRTGNSYGDWLQIGVTTPRDLLATAYFARSTEIAAETAAVLGRIDVEGEHRALHAGIREAFVKAFVADDGTIEGGTQTGYLLALAFRLLPDDLVPAAVGHLTADIRARGNRLSTGFVGVGLLCPVLSDHGHADLAYALLHQDQYPSWGYSIRHGATTIWERWDGWTEHSGFQSAAMNSFNHYSLGSIGDWLFGRVAGIDQTTASVAYRELLLRPTPGGELTYARATQETARGTVACGWSLAERRLTVTATVPPGSSALLEIPTSDPGGVTEDGAPAGVRPGVVAVEPSAAGVTLRLTSGQYSFDAATPGAVPIPFPSPSQTSSQMTTPSMRETP